MTILLVSFTGAIVVFMLIYFFVVTRLVPKNKVHQRLRELKYGSAAAAEKSKDTGSLADIPFVERTIIPFFEGLEKSLLRFAPAGIHAMLEQRIMLAGKQGIWSVNAFVCGWLLSMAAGFMLMFLLIQDKDLEFIQRVVALLLGVVMGGALPFVFLNSLIQKRQFKIQRQLPELLDLLCVSVQAGLSFDGAVTKIVGRMKGPLIDECERMQRDTRMGMPRKRSMQQMAQRCDVQEVYLFTTAVIQ
ncbi:MAG: type II secretion system F family protein, partial [Schwartzia sp.]|nr:type II secretion system F family protein [Schwartzia sp. (in: firmicutes)]